MKARVKKSTEIIDVEYKQYSLGHRKIWGYEDEEGVMWTEDDIEILNHEPDYWTRLKHQYAGMFVKSFLDQYDGSVGTEDIINSAIKVAHALVEKYKKEEK